MTTGKKRILAVAAAASMVALAMSGCTPSSSNDGGGGSKTGPTLAVFNGTGGAFTKNFNPLSPAVLSEVQGLIYEPLFYYNPNGKAGTKPIGVLGTDFTVNSTGTEVKVTLRKGVKWSDGKPFTAKDVAFTMNLIRKTPALNTSGDTPKAVATDDTHVTLTFDKPSFPSVPNILGVTYIVPEHIWKSIKDPATAVNDNPVGTGPMMEGSFTSQSYLLKKSPTFRDASKVEVGGIRPYSLSGNEAATSKLLAGQLDWVGMFIPNIQKTLSTKKDLHYTTFGSQQVELTTCSNASLGCTGPQTDVVVRHAISAAIDREQVNKLAYYGNADPISATYLEPKRDAKFIAPNLQGAEPMNADPKKAESLLQGDGWVKGSDGIYAKNGQRLSMTVLVTSGYTDYIAALQAMTQQLKTAGIEIKAQQAAGQEITSAGALGKFQIEINDILPGLTTDGYYIYDKYFLGSATGKVGTSVNPNGNISRFSNPEVDKAIAEAASTQDADTKAKAYATIQNIIVKDLTYIPIITNRSFAEYSTKQVTGFPTDDDLYAPPSPFSAPANEQVLLHLKTVKK